MYTALIIDDEAKLREVLKIKLSQYCTDIQILGEASNAADGYELIKAKRPHLIFLDIAMPLASGFDLIAKFESIDFEVIFVTGYNEYALDALKVSAVDYLLKPVQTDSLLKAVNKAKSRIDNRSKIEKYEVLKHNLSHIGDQNAKIAIPGTNAYEFVQIKNIVRCEGWQKYTKIHLTNEEVIVSSYNIGIFRDMLESYAFFSTHKSHLVNKNLIKRYLKDGTLIMLDGSSVPVARRRRETFMDHVVRHLTAF